MAIAPKKKACKGTGKAKGHGCGDETYERTYGLCQNCLRIWAVTEEEGKAWLKKQTAYKMKKNEKEKRKEERHQKSLNVDWKPKLQTVINSIVREIDNGLPCLARGRRGQMHAGHVYARGGNQTIRYNLHNIHRQSAQSNHYQNDDGALREGVVKEYGQEYMDFISGLRQTPRLEFTNAEFRDLTAKARGILKRLKSETRLYSKSERIEMRNRVNLEMGIYEQIYCEYV